MTTKNTPPKVEPAAYYQVRVCARFTFEGLEFAPLWEMEIDGATLSRLLADPDCKGKVVAFDKKD
jgi:hypothetical protein